MIDVTIKLDGKVTTTETRDVLKKKILHALETEVDKALGKHGSGVHADEEENYCKISFTKSC